VNRHGSTKAELPVIAATLAQLDEELTHHLAKRSGSVPYIAGLEKSISIERPNHTVASGRGQSIAMIRKNTMRRTLLAEIRTLSGNFTTPPTPADFHAFYDG